MSVKADLAAPRFGYCCRLVADSSGNCVGCPSDRHKLVGQTSEDHRKAFLVQDMPRQGSRKEIELDRNGPSEYKTKILTQFMDC